MMGNTGHGQAMDVMADVLLSLITLRLATSELVGMFNLTFAWHSGHFSRTLMMSYELPV